MFRLSALLVILLVLRLIFILNGLPLILPELNWMIVGEKLSDGFTMYTEVWDILEPFSAGTYYLIISFFGKSALAFKIISLVLVSFHAFFFNYLINETHLYKERTSIPGLLYVIFSSLFFDFFTLPPVLLGMTFLLPSLYLVLLQMRFKTTGETMLYTGILVGISSLFYLPLSLFLLVYILAFLFFTAGSARSYLLLILGFLLPVLLVILYYFYLHASAEFFSNLLYSFFTIPAKRFTDIKLIGLICVVPAIIIFLGLASVGTRSNYINYQYNGFKLMSFVLLAGIATLFFTIKFTPYQLYILVPVIAYFGSHFFQLGRSNIIKESFLWMILILVPLINAGFVYGFLQKNDSQILNRLLVTVPKNKPSVSLKDKKIVVIGSEPAFYLNSKLATPYLSWELSKRHFQELNNLEALSELYLNFSRDLPEVIIDQKGVMDEVLFRIPILGTKYQKLENENVYVLKP